MEAGVRMDRRSGQRVGKVTGVVALALTIAVGACSRPELDLGDRLLGEGKPAEAIRAWREALAEHPQSTKLLIRIATAQCRMDRVDEAEATLRRAVEIQPRSPKVWQNLGLVHFKQSRFDDALAAFHQVVEIQQSYPETCYYIGLIHQMRGDEKRAQHYYVRAVNYGPSRAWDNLVLMKRKQQEQGLVPKPPRSRHLVGFSLALLVLAACAYGLRLYLESREERSGGE